MSAIENLIQIKKQCKNDDIVRILDEITDYEKLSRSALFRDLTTSKAAQKKLPLLSAAYQGDLYALSLLTLAENIISHLLDHVPEVVTNPLETMTERDTRRMNAMTGSLIPVTYYGLLDYDQDSMAEHVVAVYDAKRPNGATALLIIVRDGNAYRIYQGYYHPEEETPVIEETQKVRTYQFEQNGMYLSFMTYSLLGNNRYPFGLITDTRGEQYHLSMDYHTLYVDRLDGQRAEKIPLSMAQRNELNIKKMDPRKFGEQLLSWICLYWNPVVVQANDMVLSVNPYLLLNGTSDDVFATLWRKGRKGALSWSYCGLLWTGEEESEDKEEPDRMFLRLTSEEQEELEALRNDPKQFGTTLLGYPQWKEDEEDETTGDSTDRGASEDEERQGTEEPETVAEV